jgi:hypothetical protein
VRTDCMFSSGVGMQPPWASGPAVGAVVKA